MVVKMQAISLAECEAEITDLTLLSVEEAQMARDNIPPIDDYWWLRTPGAHSCNAACVDPKGHVAYEGIHVDYCLVGVRPALRVNQKSINLPLRAKVFFRGFTWTHISDGLLLCDQFITRMPFRREWKASDANIYNASNVKFILDQLLADMHEDVENHLLYKNYSPYK